MLFKLSNLNSNLTLTLGILTQNNPALVVRPLDVRPLDIRPLDVRRLDT